MLNNNIILFISQRLFDKHLTISNKLYSPAFFACGSTLISLVSPDLMVTTF
jgi:hypothetical protein